MHSPADCDRTLAALAYVEACSQGNEINKEAIFRDDSDLVDLMIGLVILAGSLRCTLAANTGITVDEVDELLRATFLSAAAGAS